LGVLFAADAGEDEAGRRRAVDVFVMWADSIVTDADEDTGQPRPWLWGRDI
jgi:hypothetical protein